MRLQKYKSMTMSVVRHQVQRKRLRPRTVVRKLLRIGIMFLSMVAIQVLAAKAASPTSAMELRQARPGDVLRVWPLDGGAPERAIGFRILYRSVGFDGEAIAVSAAVIVPAGKAPPNGRPLVAWAHPTSGVVERCALSVRSDMSESVPGLVALLDKGYAVVATDYPGLGTSGVHPYLIGDSEARAILDSVRAVRHLPGANASDRFIVWGHSQGGHAALFAGQAAHAYAPELKLMGVAAVAPATDLPALFKADRGTVSGRILTAMALYSWSRVFGLPLDEVVAPNALSAVTRVGRDCIRSLGEFAVAEQNEKSLEQVFLKADPTRNKQLRSIMDKNSASVRFFSAPVLIVQGTEDQLVRPAMTRRFVRRLCLKGTEVTYLQLEGVSHAFAAFDSADFTVAWMDARFNGEKPHTSEKSCRSLLNSAQR